MKLIREIIISFIFICYPCSSMLSQIIVKDKPKVEESVVIFTANEDNSTYYLVPIVIIKENKLLAPPVMDVMRASYNFISDYFEPSYSYYKVNSAGSDKEITVKETPILQRAEDGYTFGISAKIKINNEKLIPSISNCLFTNSLFLSKKPIATNITDELTKKKTIELFTKYFQKENGINKTQSFSIKDIYSVSINKKMQCVVAKLLISESGLDFKKECVVIINATGINWKIVDYKPLFSVLTGSGEWGNNGYNYIDAADVDFDGNNELIFSYSEGGYGHKILKYVSGKWKQIYFTSYGS